MKLALPVTFGRSRRTLTVGGFRLTEACYDAGLVVAPHRHRYPSWTVVLDGCFAEHFRRETVTAGTGTLLAKPADALHSNTYGSAGASVLLIELIDDGGVGSEVADAFQEVCVLSPDLARGALARLRSETALPAAGGLGVHCALLDLALLVARPRHERPLGRRRNWLHAVQARLRAEFASAPSLEGLAMQAGVHPVHLCTAFRAAYGCSPGEFVRRLQLEQAKHCLTHSSESVSRIAHQLGFSDHSHLTRRFRAAYGLTPSAYRRLTAA